MSVPKTDALPLGYTSTNPGKIGFEPMVNKFTLVFKTNTLNHSATYPI